jgi:hypothetical protein
MFNLEKFNKTSVLSRRNFLLGMTRSLATLAVANTGVYVIGSAFKSLDGSIVAGAKCDPNMGQTCYAIVPFSGYFDSGTGDCSTVGMCTGCADGTVALCSSGIHKCLCNEGTIQCDGSCFWY